jgi:pyruvate kinase
MPSKNTKIIATVGPANVDEHTLCCLVEGKPTGVLIDLQGPKLRLGVFTEGCIPLARGDRIRFDLDPAPGNATRVEIPHPEIIAAVGLSHVFLVDDGKMRLKVVAKDEGVLHMEALADGSLSDRNGVNVPDVSLPLSALTTKDKRDLAFDLDRGRCLII